jgi:hypothetical protein
LVVLKLVVLVGYLLQGLLDPDRADIGGEILQRTILVERRSRSI